MSESGQLSSVGLWPLPDQMIVYLKSWESYVIDLEKRGTQQEVEHKNAVSALYDELSRAQHQVITVEGPLRKQIVELQSKLKHAEATANQLREEIATATSRLAQGLEVSTATRGLVLITLINDALVLVDEAKRQLRESL